MADQTLNYKSLTATSNENEAVAGKEDFSRQVISNSAGDFNMLNFGMNNFTKTVNFKIGGQMGMGPKIHNLDAATPQVFRNSIIIVTQTPNMFNNMGTQGNGQNYKKLVQYLIETYAHTVSGLDFNYTLNTGEMPVGYDGQKMPVPTQTQRSPVAPSFVFTELLGGLIWKFFNFWIRCIQDPDSNISLASALFPDGATANDAVTSSWSMSFIAIQPDTTLRPNNIIDAAFYTAAFPTECGDFGFNKAVGATDIKERTVNFKALVQHNTNTLYYGREIMKILKFHELDYSYSTVRGDIETDIQQSGIMKDVFDAAVNEFPATKGKIESQEEARESASA
jgi:hypothetical protein